MLKLRPLVLSWMTFPYADRPDPSPERSIPVFTGPRTLDFVVGNIRMDLRV